MYIIKHNCKTEKFTCNSDFTKFAMQIGPIPDLQDIRMTPRRPPEIREFGNFEDMEMMMIHVELRTPEDDEGSTSEDKTVKTGGMPSRCRSA